MKKHILLLVTVISIIFTGCKVGRTTESRGLENESYLQFVQGQKVYEEGVDVFVDGIAPFKAKVDKMDSRMVKGNIYTVKSGTRHLKVEYKGSVLYEKNVVLASQETRQIQLP